MCNPIVAQVGLQAAGQVGGYMSQRAAVKARNRAKLLNFRQDNIAYYNDALLSDVGMGVGYEFDNLIVDFNTYTYSNNNSIYGITIASKF